MLCTDSDVFYAMVDICLPQTSNDLNVRMYVYAWYTAPALDVNQSTEYS